MPVTCRSQPVLGYAEEFRVGLRPSVRAITTHVNQLRPRRELRGKHDNGSDTGPHSQLQRRVQISSKAEIFISRDSTCALRVQPLLLVILRQDRLRTATCIICASFY